MKCLFNEIFTSRDTVLHGNEIIFSYPYIDTLVATALGELKLVKISPVDESSTIIEGVVHGLYYYYGKFRIN